MTTVASYTGVLKTGSQAGPGMFSPLGLSMFPEHATSGSGSAPVPVAAVLAGGLTGASYSETISDVGGVSPYSYALASGALPTGLSLSSAGVISGTPTATGTFTFTVQVTDANGSTGTTTFQIIIAAPSSGASNYSYAS